jgi:IS1 family transposase
VGLCEKKDKTLKRQGRSSEEEGSIWDHVAIDPESKLIISMVQSRNRDQRSCERLVEELQQRLVKAPALVTTDEHEAYAKSLLSVFGVEYRVTNRGPGEEELKRKRMPKRMVHATVKKTRRKGRVEEVRSRLSLGTDVSLVLALGLSKVSKSINTAFVERYNGTARHFNARKGRKTYSFSERLGEHQAMSWQMVTHYNFCWAHSSLRRKRGDGTYRKRSPAMAARLTDHVWTVKEMITKQIFTNSSSSLL